jgi:hypothetical protein
MTSVSKVPWAVFAGEGILGISETKVKGWSLCLLCDSSPRVCLLKSSSHTALSSLQRRIRGSNSFLPGPIRLLKKKRKTSCLKVRYGFSPSSMPVPCVMLQSVLQSANWNCILLICQVLASCWIPGATGLKLAQSSLEQTPFFTESI